KRFDAFDVADDGTVQKKNGRGQFIPTDAQAARSQKLAVARCASVSAGSGKRRPSASRAALRPRNGTSTSTRFLNTSVDRSLPSPFHNISRRRSGLVIARFVSNDRASLP